MTINGRLDSDGAVTIHISAPIAAVPADADNDFDVRMNAFAGR